MYVERKILENVMSALNTRCFFSLGLLEKHLNARLELWIKSSQFFLHHRYYLVIVLQSQKDILLRSQFFAKRANLHTLHCFLKLTNKVFAMGLF